MTKNFLHAFPQPDDLRKWHKGKKFPPARETNAHIHTPASFSAFGSIEQIFVIAAKEGIEVLGINDFYTADGYEPFHDLAVKQNIFPLFSIEFIGLLREEQQKGIRVNDPENPGRTYLCGKGLDFPFHLPGPFSVILEKVKEESQRQIRQMIEKLNVHASSAGLDMVWDYDTIRSAFAEKLVRERHLARAVRSAVWKTAATPGEQRTLLQRLFSGVDPKANVNSAAAVENEIRSRLLKAGGPAFVGEDPEAFLEIGQVKSIIHAAGGLPCYPVLLDNRQGEMTAFEQDWPALMDKLRNLGIGLVEMIPLRNDAAVLERFVRLFHRNNFVVTFGTEHNTPDLIPLTIRSRDGNVLDDDLRHIGYEGACVVAAHQYCRARGMKGYTGEDGQPRMEQKQAFAELGRAVIDRFFTQ